MVQRNGLDRSASTGWKNQLQLSRWQSSRICNLATPFLSTYRIDVISNPKFFTKLQFQVSDPPSPGGDQLKGFWRLVEMESGCLLDDSQQREIIRAHHNLIPWERETIIYSNRFCGYTSLFNSFCIQEKTSTGFMRNHIGSHKHIITQLPICT